MDLSSFVCWKRRHRSEVTTSELHEVVYFNVEDELGAEHGNHARPECIERLYVLRSGVYNIVASAMYYLFRIHTQIGY